ncbi:MAG TPA: VOC family protein [Terriglobales bacterium]|nr:VOC family protein [Terriglobales bacterium]
MTLGPVSIRTNNIDRMLSFYEQDLGLNIISNNENTTILGSGQKTVEPILILNNDEKAATAPKDAAGLYHFAILVPDRRSLSIAYLGIGKRGIIFDGYADHLVSEALYLTDPDGNGIEIYSDRPRKEWKRDEDGGVQMATQPLDIDSLIKESSATAADDLEALPEGAKIGHVHLKVSNLQKSIAFYRDLLGLDLMSYWGSAAFLSAGGYHHHVGLNTWESLDGPRVDKSWIGIEHYTANVTKDNFTELSSRLADSPIASSQGSSQLYILDPDNITIIVHSS